jgi:hypothetical protein
MTIVSGYRSLLSRELGLILGGSPAMVVLIGQSFGRSYVWDFSAK